MRGGMAALDDCEYKRVMLDKIQYFVRREFGRDMLLDMELSEIAEHFSGSVVMELRGFMHGKKLTKTERKVVQVPATWWDAIKERFTPAWVKHRNWLMPKYRKIVTEAYYEETRICPHLDIHSNRDSRAHITWIDEPFSKGLVMEHRRGN